ncbi:MAG: acyl-CoA dehydrogenase family protein, partial [Thermoanaerobaculia bacterium]
MSTELLAPPIPPLTTLAEHERELAEGVYQFALETIAPRVMAMDRDNVMDPAIIKKFFEMDLMGIEIPEEYGGLGSNFTTSIAIIEALARMDASAAVVVDV